MQKVNVCNRNQRVVMGQSAVIFAEVISEN
jgi:hypothetical protein